MSSDPIVIVAAARTPLGRFQGELGGLPAPALGAHVIRAALERARLAPDRVDEVLMGCVLPAGRARRRRARPRAGRAAGRHRRHHRQQGLRLGHEGDHARPRPDRGRLGRDRGGRRHGIDVERALSAGQGARRLPRRPRPHPRPHDARRAGGRLRGRPLHGRFRRGHGPGLSVHPRRPGCLRRGDADARPQGDRERRVRRRDRADRGAGEGRRPRGRQRREPDEGLAREDPGPASRRSAPTARSRPPAPRPTPTAPRR